MSPTASTDSRHLPLTLPLALPAATGVFIVTIKTRSAHEAGLAALILFVVVLFAPALLKATAKTAAALAKPRKKPKDKKKDKKQR
ncbi:hypothetical protein [Streptomyces chartreusis]|uniref:Uncharacterized protein n=1 Tax=Streptomyces chartreusis TaxID=1969 RepID=A0A7H8TBB6_STRCX|nr:hypothetical protein [Streptomyces chartreusis]QKZ20288.1 hypothetical protein HUT05_24805 [Streptomyces chartreusis]